MSKSIVGTFVERSAAEAAVRELRERGVREEQIGVLGSAEERARAARAPTPAPSRPAS